MTFRRLIRDRMMQKVHSGVVVHSESGRLRIKSIDQEVWQIDSKKKEAYLQKDAKPKDLTAAFRNMAHDRIRD